MKIAIVDSGVHLSHPHVGHIAGGIGINSPDYIDRLGHGTAVAGAIREKVPNAELYAVKVFDDRLSARIESILEALRWCVAHEMDIVNLSVGIRNPQPIAQIENLPLIVATAELSPDAIVVAPEESCPRDVYRYHDGIFHSSPYPRPIPGVRPERNLHGASFAVANMTGFVARTLAEATRETIRSVLIARAANNP